MSRTPTKEPLDHYLEGLDAALTGAPIQLKMDILVQQRTQLLEFVRKQGGGNMDAVLQSFGKPEALAQRLLSERGIVLRSSKRLSAPKLFTIIVLGFFTAIFICFTILVWRFTPLFEMDSTTGRVRILGGAIDINDGEVAQRLEKQWSQLGQAVTRSGRMTMDAQLVETIQIDFANGQFDLRQSTDGQFAWNCKVSGDLRDDPWESTDKRMKLNLRDNTFAQCDFSVPDGFALALNGANGAVDLIAPRFNAYVSLANGAVNFRPDQGSAYKYDIDVRQGTKAEFKSSAATDAYQISIVVTNGEVTFDQ